MNAVIGHLNLNGQPVLNNASQTLTDIAALLGSTWSNPVLKAGHCALSVDANGIPDSWSSNGYVLEASCSDGRAWVFDVWEDSQNPGQLIRGGTSPWAIGHGASAGCQGCTGCYVIYDSELNQIGCGCASEGECRSSTQSV